MFELAAVIVDECWFMCYMNFVSGKINSRVFIVIFDFFWVILIWK